MWVSGWNRPWQRNAFFFSRPTLEAEASPGQTQFCSQGGRRPCGSVCFVGGQILFILKFSLLHRSYPSVLPLMCFRKTSCWSCKYYISGFLPASILASPGTNSCSHRVLCFTPDGHELAMLPKAKFGFFFSVSAYGITRDLIWSNCWILLLTEFPFWGDSGTATFDFSDQALGVRMFSLSLSTLFLFVSDSALLRFELTAVTKHRPVCTREVQRGHEQVTHVPVPAAVAQFPCTGTTSKG